MTQRVTVTIDGPDYWRLGRIAEAEGRRIADVFRDGLLVALGDRDLAKRVHRLRGELHTLEIAKRLHEGVMPETESDRALMLVRLGLTDRHVSVITGLRRSTIGSLRREAGLPPNKETKHG